MVEEKKYIPGKMVYIGSDIGFFNQTDRLDNKCHLFLAFECTSSPIKIKGEEKQKVETIVLEPDEVQKLIKDGQIKDVATVTGLIAHFLPHEILNVIGYKIPDDELQETIQKLKEKNQ